MNEKGITYSAGIGLVILSENILDQLEEIIANSLKMKSSFHCIGAGNIDISPMFNR